MNQSINPTVHQSNNLTGHASMNPAVCQSNDNTSFTLSILVANRAGALSRITSLFSRRGFNIDTLNVGPMAEDPTLSRLIMTSSGDEATKNQIIKQLDKLFDVVDVKLI